jgi:membrane-bound lytic murein transglycosylase D
MNLKSRLSVLTLAVAGAIAAFSVAAEETSAVIGSVKSVPFEPLPLNAPLNPAVVGDLDPSAEVGDNDLWQRVRRGFVMEELNSPLVQTQEQWYASRQDYIQRFVERGSRYLYYIVEEVERRGLPTEIVLLPIIESAFNPQAYSRAQASGMWQFIPSTGKNFGLKQDWSADHRRDVVLSTDAALNYLTRLYGMFNSWELAFAAYNCGEGCVARAIAKNQRKGVPTDFVNLKLPPETKSYVPKLIAVKNIILSPSRYGIDLATVDNRPYFTKVDAPEKIDVKLAARLAEMEEDEFVALNPAFTKPVAATSTGYFLVPMEKAETFRINLDLYRSLNGPLVSWQTVNAKRGESVDSVARRYGMTASYLRATNGPFRERKGKFTQAATFMAPLPKQAEVIRATLDKKVALKNTLLAAAPNSDVPLALPAAHTSPAAPAPAHPMLALTSTVNPQTPAVAVPSAAPVQTASTSVPATNAALTSMPSPPSATVAVASVPEGPATYEVRAGDTLFSVAKRFNLTLEQLKGLNALTHDQIKVGQTLMLAGVPDSTSSLIAVASNAPATLVNVSVAAAAKALPKLYTVRAGDTLFGIAQKFGVAIDNLLKWNGLSAKSILQPGKRLRITA